MTSTKPASRYSKKPQNPTSLEYSLHAPFADINIASPVKPLLNASIKRLNQSLANANGLDAKMWVFHPGNAPASANSIPALTSNNVPKHPRTLHKAEEYGVNIALENLPAKYWFLMNTPEEFMRMYKETNLPIGITMDLDTPTLKGKFSPSLTYLPTKSSTSTPATTTARRPTQRRRRRQHRLQLVCREPKENRLRQKRHSRIHE